MLIYILIWRRRRSSSAHEKIMDRQRKGAEANDCIIFSPFKVTDGTMFVRFSRGFTLS